MNGTDTGTITVDEQNRILRDLGAAINQDIDRKAAIAQSAYDLAREQPDALLIDIWRAVVIALVKDSN
jgi:hypothetical protein